MDIKKWTLVLYLLVTVTLAEETKPEEKKKDLDRQESQIKVSKFNHHGHTSSYNNHRSQRRGRYHPGLVTHHISVPGYVPVTAYDTGHRGINYHYNKESPVHRNPYDAYDVHDAVRTRDGDLHYREPHYSVTPKYEPYHEPRYTHRAKPHHEQRGYTPYHYSVKEVPECAYTNKHYYNITFCLEDPYYPVETIQYELSSNKAYLDKLLSDISYQSADNLVDGLTKAEEEDYTYQHYYGVKKHHYAPPYRNYEYSKEYYKKGGYLCPSDIYYGRPKRAINTYGEWKVIVNLPDDYYSKGYDSYTQTQRLEQCLYPEAPCSYIDHSYGLHSACKQKHNFVRMLAYTYENGLHIDSFKLPIACSCHVSQTYGYTSYGSYGYVTTPSYNKY